FREPGGSVDAGGCRAGDVDAAGSRVLLARMDSRKKSPTLQLALGTAAARLCTPHPRACFSSDPSCGYSVAPIRHSRQQSAYFIHAASPMNLSTRIVAALDAALVRFQEQQLQANAPGVVQPSGTDEEVVVAFEHGAMRSAVVVGQLWNSVDRPPTSA